MTVILITTGILLWIMAAICNAVMDVISFHYEISIFHNGKLDIYWWCPGKSWLNKYVDRNPFNPKRKILWGLMDRPFTDAWHTFKSLMIVFMAGSITCLALSGTDCSFNLIAAISSMVLFGILWNTTFNLFYNHVLI